MIFFFFDLEIKLWKLENLTNDSQIFGLNESENDYRSNPLGFRNGDVKNDHWTNFQSQPSQGNV